MNTEFKGLGQEIKMQSMSGDIYTKTLESHQPYFTLFDVCQMVKDIEVNSHHKTKWIGIDIQHNALDRFEKRCINGEIVWCTIWGP